MCTHTRGLAAMRRLSTRSSERRLLCVSPGVCARLTMGDNNWEKFQVWLDEDPDKAGTD